MNFHNFIQKANPFYVKQIDGALVNSVAEIDSHDIEISDDLSTDFYYEFEMTEVDGKVDLIFINPQSLISFNEFSGLLIVDDIYKNSRNLNLVREVRMTMQVYEKIKFQ